MIRRKLHSLLLAATAGLLPSGTAKAQPAQGVVDRLDQCFALQAASVPFSGIALASDGHGRFERTAGFADAAGMSRPTSAIPFRLASVQKVLTGVAIGQLVDRGTIKLDAPIGLYLRGLSPEFARVTIEQLLHHQSGVASFTLLNPKLAQSLAAARSARDLVPLVTSQPLAFPPGSRTEYSNGGYYLLGAVIEAVSGQTYADYLQSHIFSPLHMTRSSLVATPDTATRYSSVSPTGPLGAPRPILAGPSLPPTAAGDGVSSAADMLLLGRALVKNTLISEAVKERIFPRRTTPWRIGQSGGSIGENTDFSVYPESGWVVVVLSNYDPPAGELMGEVLRKVATGESCQPLSTKDRPSPFRMITRPPPPAEPA